MILFHMEVHSKYHLLMVDSIQIRSRVILNDVLYDVLPVNLSLVVKVDFFFAMSVFF